MQHLKGNILDVEYGIICQQVNCKLVMGAGLAKQIRDKWPRVYTEYKLMMSTNHYSRLGKCQIVEVITRKLYVANLFGQYAYGGFTKKHTNYNALTQAIQKLDSWHKSNCHNSFPIWIPYKLGCGLAGGDWEIVQSILFQNLSDYFIVQRHTGN